MHTYVWEFMCVGGTWSVSVARLLSRPGNKWPKALSLSLFLSPSLSLFLAAAAAAAALHSFFCLFFSPACLLVYSLPLLSLSLFLCLTSYRLLGNVADAAAVCRG